jgi:cytidylate kinase
MKQTEPLVITISRDAGSGASYVGHHLAKNLGMGYVDRVIVREAAVQLSVLEKDLESMDEAVPSFWRAFVQNNYFFPDVYAPPKLMLPSGRELFEVESKIISRIAHEAPAVIVGRCGFHVLREHPNHVRVFLHGHLEFRTERFQKLYQLTRAEAARAIARLDKARNAYCKAFTGRDGIDARNFDLSIDTSRLVDLDQATELILHYVRLRQPPTP